MGGKAGGRRGWRGRYRSLVFSSSFSILVSKLSANRRRGRAGGREGEGGGAGCDDWLAGWLLVFSTEDSSPSPLRQHCRQEEGAATPRHPPWPFVVESCFSYYLQFSHLNWYLTEDSNRAEPHCLCAPLFTLAVFCCCCLSFFFSRPTYSRSLCDYVQSWVSPPGTGLDVTLVCRRKMKLSVSTDRRCAL